MVGIIGGGVVGKATAAVLERGGYKVLVYDKHKEGGATLAEINGKCSIVFVCVPTPMGEHGAVDLSIITEAVSYIHGGKTIVIRSTVPPGTTEHIQAARQDCEVLFMPEFLTEADPIADALNASRVVIGGLNTNELVAMMTACYDQPNIIQTHSRNAEAYKYTCNCILAAQVAVSNDISMCCKALGVDYRTIQPWLTYDSRIGGHTRVPGPDGQNGYGGKCLPKDMAGLVAAAKDQGYTPPVLSAAIRFNAAIRKDHDWLRISGAVSNAGKPLKG
jgi:UDPglucose 6-dehydrogenase